ncbi:MAG TPA: NAD-dependent epimerase/dehydratase family protein, partial [Solimonas sp.]|nr:NAD-dependent epimerase/dehydratase family protein [Solimonas sp.]
MSKTALVAGPTGMIGQLLIERLLRHPAYAAVNALSRRPLAHDEARLRTLITDYSDLSARGAELRADDVFCCLGTTMRAAGSRAAFERVDFDMVLDLARGAHRAGARQFLVVSAAGASLKSGAYYSRVKARMEQAVAQVPF